MITSSIARMNMFLHGIEEFQIERGNTLSDPAFMEDDQLMTFNIILANPPYSIKAWNRKSFATDLYGRNIWGTPPQGCADYAFQQHIHKSLDKQKGRCAILWPHGILFRDSEESMRRKMIEEDVVECVIGLGPNLFYNSSMVSCLLITCKKKAENRKGKILFIQAVDEVRKEKTMSYLDDKHIKKILNVYHSFKSISGFSKVEKIENILKDKNARLSVELYVQDSSNSITVDQNSLVNIFNHWKETTEQLDQSMKELFKVIEK